MTKKRKRKIAMKKMDKECWNLDQSFLNWLNPRLKQFLNRGGKVVDFSYHKFTIRGEEKTQGEWIKEMIYLCDWLCSDKNTYDKSYCDKQHYLCEIWTEVLPAMWW